MPKSVIEAIFASKKDLSDDFPTYPGIKYFDLEKKQLFYGRIDKEGDAIYINHSGLKQVYGGKLKTHFVVDFVKDAFTDLKTSINKTGNAGFANNNSLFKTKMRVYKAWEHGDPEYEYNLHLNNLYTNFVSSYLAIDNRHAKVKNYKDFVKEFVRYASRLADKFPVTKTGFLTSNKCSPFSSGLMLEIAGESHGIERVDRIRSYYQDPNMRLIASEASKFGFMVDKNAPWRLIFNIASGRLNPQGGRGGAKYMMQRGVDYDNIFETYYHKAYRHELDNIKLKFTRLYEQFYDQYQTYSTQAYTKCIKNQDSYDLQVITQRKEREPPQGPGAYRAMQTHQGVRLQRELDEYWLKVLLKLRMSETNPGHSQKDLNYHLKKVVESTRLYGSDAALEYINNLTKGFHVITFNTKGKYWHGKTQAEYDATLKRANDTALDPSLVDYSITGTKNIQ